MGVDDVCDGVEKVQEGGHLHQDGFCWPLLSPPSPPPLRVRFLLVCFLLVCFVLVCFLLVCFLFVVRFLDFRPPPNEQPHDDFPPLFIGAMMYVYIMVLNTGHNQL